MTDLQTSLIVIGVMIVAGVICYNKWHEFRARKHVERAFSAEQEDVLMKSTTEADAAGRHEPVFDEKDFPAIVGDFFNGTGTEMSPVVPAGHTVELLPVDEMIDCVIPLSLNTPIHGEKILPLLQTLRHVGSKPVHFMGLEQSASTTSKPEWRPVVHGGVYSELQAGVQLASRNGALNELEYSELIVRLHQIADEIDAEPDIPDMSTVMVSARTLYQFVSQHDARLGLNIRSNSVPWSMSTLLTALERQGFGVRPDGRFVMQDVDGGPLFTLTTNEAVTAENTSCLTLLLDVPRIAAHQNGFGAMVVCAKSLAKRLNGTIVDDGMQTLSDAALDEIAHQVNEFHDDMQTAGISAGSPRALRLFI
jgi:hypothetical protein